MFHNAPGRSPLLRNSAHNYRSIRHSLATRTRFRRLRHEPLEDRRVLSGITFNDFSDPAGLNLVGDAAIANGNILRLTPAVGGMEGAAWYNVEKPYVSVPWETTFAFNLNENFDAPGGSDGFTFIIQNHQPTYLAGGGGTLGYYALPNSLVVEFDTFQNSEVNDPSGSHISVHTNGTDSNSWDEALSIGAYTTPTIIDDATTHTAKITYVPGTLKVYLDDLSNPVITASIDLSETLSLDAGRAWIGFTATTGGGYQNHDILNWTYNVLVNTDTTVSVGDASVTEDDAGTQDMTFTVTRSGVASGTTTVAWTTENRAATGGSDFVAASGQLVFDPQVVAQTVTIAVLGDTLVEPHETLALRLSNATGGIVADGIGIGTIVNDDVSLSISDTTVTEGGSGLRFIDAFVPQQYGGLYDPRGVTVGPDGDIFVASAIAAQVLRFDGASGQFLGVFADASAAGSDARTGTVLFHGGDLYVSTGANNSILRFDGESGFPLPAPGKDGAEFVTAGDGGLEAAWGMDFGPDGRLYVASALTHEVLVYDGVTGNFDGVFVPAGDQGLNQPLCIAFGSDGNLYVGSSGTNEVLRYQGPFGEEPGAFIDDFVTAGSGGLAFLPAAGMVFGPDGDLYVCSRDSDSVLRYDGLSGSFIEAAVPAGSGGLDQPKGLAFDSQGFLLVSSGANHQILRYGAASCAVVTVTLAQPVPFDVTVDFATANGTALAGSDYIAATGQFLVPATFSSRSIAVPTLDDPLIESTEFLVVNLSNLSDGMLADGQAVVTIRDNDTKFYVVNDGASDSTFEYANNGTAGEATNLDAGNTAPRGAASTVAGDKVWVVDANKKVYVYDDGGVLLGSWSLGSLNPKATVQGITTNGTDIWVVDSNTDKVYRYAGAASRVAGSQNAASSFSLNTKGGNTNPTDIVTDGISLWVPNNSSVDKVFKYTTAGALVGSWTITTSGATSPTGITIDPANVSHMWIVDSVARRVYQYNSATTLPNGSSKAADDSFALAAGNTNPQGIADPPVAAVPPLSQPALNPPATRTEDSTDAVLRGMTWLPWEDVVLLQAVDQPALTAAGLPASDRYRAFEMAWQADQVPPLPAESVEQTQVGCSTKTDPRKVRDDLLAAWSAEDDDVLTNGLVDGI